MFIHTHARAQQGFASQTCMCPLSQHALPGAWVDAPAACGLPVAEGTADFCKTWCVNTDAWLHVCHAFLVHEAMIAIVGSWEHMCSNCMHTLVCYFLWAQVLLMQWNAHFDWEKPKFQFVELFSGAAHTSREWPWPEIWNLIACMFKSLSILRKRRGFNVGRLDIIVGQEAGSPESHDFLSTPGFLSCAQQRHAWFCDLYSVCI